MTTTKILYAFYKAYKNIMTLLLQIYQYTGHFVRKLFIINNLIKLFSIYFFFKFFFFCKKNNFLINSLNESSIQPSYYDVILHSNSTFTNLVIVNIVIFLLILALTLQSSTLNFSLYQSSFFDSEKYSPYECGFAPFKTEWAQFDIKFYLIALLFLVFDVELMFILPYNLTIFKLETWAHLTFLGFFILLLLGFLIEWSAGMLVWKQSSIQGIVSYDEMHLNNEMLIFYEHYIAETSLNKYIYKTFLDIKTMFNWTFLRWIKRGKYNWIHRIIYRRRYRPTDWFNFDSLVFSTIGILNAEKMLKDRTLTNDYRRNDFVVDLYPDHVVDMNNFLPVKDILELRELFSNPTDLKEAIELDRKEVIRYMGEQYVMDLENEKAQGL